ncbi:hypothetical protein [Epibacterium ulvae]|uniref:hypothetical protein n=1 Tax=Epibacterium ulvae TaxID=1156985 RepID=UPI002490DA03|nr:hypothetical protein [Epibacterium ulvae]
MFKKIENNWAIAALLLVGGISGAFLDIKEVISSILPSDPDWSVFEGELCANRGKGEGTDEQYLWEACVESNDKFATFIAMNSGTGRAVEIRLRHITDEHFTDPCNRSGVTNWEYVSADEPFVLSYYTRDIILLNGDGDCVTRPTLLHVPLTYVTSQYEDQHGNIESIVVSGKFTVLSETLGTMSEDVYLTPVPE